MKTAKKNRGLTLIETMLSLVVFALLTLPLLVVGFVAMSASGTSLLKIRREVQSLAGRRARSSRCEMRSQSPI